MSPSEIAGERIAYILAAGYSRRLKHLTRDRPKAFLEVQGRRLIDYHLGSLVEHGVGRIVIVVGFLRKLFRQAIGDRYRSATIEYVDNEAFETTGHSYSLYLGRDVLRRHPTVLIHADVFCDPGLYAHLLDAPQDNVVLVDEHYEVMTHDECLVAGRNGIVTRLALGTTGLPDVRGEFLGLSKFHPRFMTEFCDFTERYFERHGRQANYEVVLDRFLDHTGALLHYRTIGGKPWVNVNYAEDLAHAQDIARLLFDR